MIEKIAGYTIKRLINTGSTSKVYLAFDEKLKRNVAIKILSPSYSREKRITKRFIKEARTAAQLQHSNIISIYDVGKEKNYYFIAMEFLNNSLRNKIRRNSLKNSYIEVLNIMRDIAKALSYSHKRGFIHRDIKPDNIMFRSDGTVVVADFGIVKALKSGSNLTKTGMSIGTPKYMSPEQIRAKRIDGRSDIYSLGIVFYEMLTGDTPYKDPDIVKLALKHTSGPIPILPKKIEFLQPLLNKMLAKNPGQRVRDCDGLIRLIDTVSFRIKQQKTNVLKKYSGKTPAVKTHKSKNAKKEKQTTYLKILLTAILLLIFLSIYLIKESAIKKEENLWNTTKERNSISAYNNYLFKYPNGRFTPLAEEIKKNLQLKNELYKRYLRDAGLAYESGRYRDAMNFIKKAEKYCNGNPGLNSLKTKIKKKITR